MRMSQATAVAVAVGILLVCAAGIIWYGAPAAHLPSPAAAQQAQGRSIPAQATAEAVGVNTASGTSLEHQAQQYYRQAYRHGEVDDFTAAAECFQQILEQCRDSELADDAQYQRAICYFAQQDYEQAIEEFEKVRQCFPDSHLSLRAQGWIERAQVKQAAQSDECLQTLLYHDTTPAPPRPLCGPKALKLICDELDVSAQVDEIAQLAGTDDTGTSMYGLAQAAQALGLEPQGLQVDLAYLQSMELPVIAWIGGNHYVVVTDITRNAVYMTEPDRGELVASREDFQRLWGGHVLAVSVDPHTSDPDEGADR